MYHLFIGHSQLTIESPLWHTSESLMLRTSSTIDLLWYILSKACPLFLFNVWLLLATCAWVTRTAYYGIFWASLLRCTSTMIELICTFLATLSSCDWHHGACFILQVLSLSFDLCKWLKRRRKLSFFFCFYSLIVVPYNSWSTTYTLSPSIVLFLLLVHNMIDLVIESLPRYLGTYILYIIVCVSARMHETWEWLRGKTLAGSQHPQANLLASSS